VTLAVLDMSLAGGLLPGSGTMRYAQTMAFTTLVFCQLFNVFNARSDDISAFHQLFTNKWLWGAIALSILLQVAVVYVPLLNQGFGTAPIGWLDWLICAGMASIVLWMDEIKKVVLRTLEWRAAHNAA
ncbi:MAG: cation transporting ATPase C-terminal domain-containing protein, partial [Caldilineaceae bacterium]|nr:cation transporting ATPase C-terminal domain-containing protein [Caldilineaceae bacterium]